jgi:hypothetical protein
MRQILNWLFACLVVGIVYYAWQHISALPPLGKLPGDVFINRPEIQLYVPVTSCLALLLVWEAGNKAMQKLTA